MYENKFVVKVTTRNWEKRDSNRKIKKIVKFNTIHTITQ